MPKAWSFGDGTKNGIMPTLPLDKAEDELELLLAT